MTDTSAAAPKGKWVMTSRRDGGDISFYIGQVKIANIHLVKKHDTSWSAYLRFMDDEPRGATYDTVSEAMRVMHEHLRSPPNEGD